MIPKFLIPYVDIAINKGRKVSHSFITQLRRWQFNPHKLQRVLISQLPPGTGIGDYIQSSPLAIALKKTSPDVEISYLVSGEDELAIFKLFPVPVSIISLMPTQVNYNFLLTFVENEIYPKRFDLIIHGEWEDTRFAKAITQNGGFRNSIGYFSKRLLGTYPFLTMPLPSLSGSFRSFRPPFYDDNNLKQILDVEIKWEPKLIIKNINEADGVNDFIDQGKKSGYKILGLHSGGKIQDKLKRWPSSNFMYVALWFRKQFNGRVLIFGGPHEEEEVHVMVEKAGDNEVIAVVGQHLLKVARLINKCDIFVSNDSGIMHLSMALGVHSIGICGPTDMHNLKNVYPNAVFLGEKMPCCPCYGTNQYMSCIEDSGDFPECLTLIKPDEVIEKIEQMLVYDYSDSNVNRTSSQIRDTKPN